MKRLDTMAPDEVQRGNREWWNRNTMSYDWKDAVGPERYSSAWFDEIDRRFIHAARLFAAHKTPFDRIIPFERLPGARVLEIGCGMGLHTELMAKAGARVTAIDITPSAVEATRKRLALKGLAADVRECDAEHLPFEAGSFDFVWSWGVIHHSANTARVVREIARVATPEGEARVMVYNREGVSAWAVLVRDYLLKGRFLSMTYDEVLWETSDGFTARFYVREQFEDLFRGFFTDVSGEVMGQDADAVPLPRFLRSLVLALISRDKLVRWQARRGAFLFVRARNPF